MIQKKLSEITQEDILALIEDGVKEGQTLDFKQEYNIEKEDKKWNFLADITAFANTIWGDIIFWIREEGSIAKEIIPIVDIDFDEEKRKIEQIVMNGIEPRLKVQIRELPVNGGYILIIRVQKSSLSPHRVVYTQYSKTQDKFYWRNSIWNFQLNVTELREAFLKSEKLSQKIENFKNQRIIEIHSHSLPLPWYFPDETWKVVLHVIPVEQFEDKTTINIKELTAENTPRPLWPVSGYSWKINFDGFLLYSVNYDNDENAYITWYTQVFRNGTLEWVSNVLIRTRFWNEKRIPTQTLEQELIERLKQFLDFVRNQWITSSIYISLTLLNAKGYPLGVSYRNSYIENDVIDRDILPLDSFLVEDLTIAPEYLLKNAFDVLWNTCWYSGSENYDQTWKRIV